MQKVIEFNGLTRALPDSTSVDGDAALLVNLRKKDGALRAVPTPALNEEVVFDRLYTRVFEHKVGDHTNYICYDATTHEVVALVKATPNSAYAPQTLVTDVTLNSIEAFGNRVILFTEGKPLRVATFSEGKYTVLGTILPFGQDSQHPADSVWPIVQFRLKKLDGYVEIPRGAIDLDTPIDSPNNDDPPQTGDNVTISVNTSAASQIADYISGMFGRIADDLHMDNCVANPVLMRYALRLVDGSYIQHSPPLLLLPQERQIVTTFPVTRVQFNIGNKWYDEVRFSEARATKYTIEYCPYYEKLDQYRDIVEAIDVFMSTEIPLYNVDRKVSKMIVQGGSGELNLYTVKFDLPFYTEPEFAEQIVNTAAFYRVASLPIKNHENVGKWQSINLTDIISGLEQQPSLLPDDLTHHGLSAQTTLNYNNRIHAADITRILSPMYPLHLFQLFNGDPDFPLAGHYFGYKYSSAALFDVDGDPVAVYVTIQTESGEKVVKSEPVIPSFLVLKPYITYPDSRATELTIVVKKPTPNPSYFYYYTKTLLLTAHPLLNLAYYINPTLAPIIDFEVSDTPPADSTVNNIERSPNVLRVSEVSNPFYFPAKNTYSPSSAPIVAVAANTIPLSSGQFGQYPLYIFTQDGIFALAAGNGDVTYATTSPVSRHICNNSNVLAIDDAVVFASPQGLMAIRGNQVEQLSAAINSGAPLSAPTTPPNLFRNIVNLTTITTGFDVAPLPEETFLQYLAADNVQLGFNYTEREIIVNRPDLNYSYVLNLNSGQWHIFSVALGEVQRLHGFIENTYTRLLAFYQHSYLDLSSHIDNIVPVILISRPIKFDSFELKKFKEAALRAYAGNTAFCAFYALGSNDLRTWKDIGGDQRLADSNTLKRLDHQDFLISSKAAPAYKYFCLVFTGFVQAPDSYIALAEVDVEATFTSRFR